MCVCLPEDVLMKDAGECAICLDELLQGDTIARLPCLCIYHKGYELCCFTLILMLKVWVSSEFNITVLISCIDNWFEVNRSCPEHPSDWSSLCTGKGGLSLSTLGFFFKIFDDYLIVFFLMICGLTAGPGDGWTPTTVISSSHQCAKSHFNSSGIYV